ncbi:hypothetical protein ACPCAE_03245 [Streptomyces cinereoruber]|uniref:hypothetical protein n=1 Tax=Streptomyces cinereoruber TaxID=67260 RepID=UPI003C2D5278
MNAHVPALAESPLPHLERQVLELIAEGHTDQEVADRLGLKSAARVQYRLSRIARHFQLETVVRPQLVDHGYTRGAVPVPGLLQPLLLEAKAYGLVRALAAGRSLHAYARSQDLKPHHVQYLLKTTRAKLDATTHPSVIRRAWQRQILGPTPFAADLASMHDEAPQPATGPWVIVPLLTGYRLAGPTGGLHRTRHLDVPDQEAASAAARFLSGRPGFAPLWIAKPAHPGRPFRVSWGRPPSAVRPEPGALSARPLQQTGIRLPQRA